MAKKKQENFEDLFNKAFLKELNKKQSKKKAKAKKSSSKRLKVGGKFIDKETESDLRRFAKIRGIDVNDYIRQNESDILEFINDFSISKAETIEEIISVLKEKKMKALYEDGAGKSSPYKNKAKLIKQLIDFKRYLLSLSDSHDVHIYDKVSIDITVYPRRNTIEIHSKEIPLILSTDPKKLEDLELKNTYMYFADSKEARDAKKKKRNAKKTANSKKSVQSKKSKRSR